MPHSIKNELIFAYQEADNSLLLRQQKIAIYLGVALFPSFSILDWYVYQDYFHTFLTIRILVDIGFIFFLFAINNFPRQAKSIGLIGTLIPGIAINIMIMISEGAASPYYAGLNLIFVFMSVILPWKLLETAFVSSITILIYIGVCFIHHQQNLPAVFNWHIFGNNLAFLVGTAIICLVASHFQSARRFETFRLNFELDQRNKQLSELDKLKSHFFANISHEFRTPLTLILAPIQDLLDGSHHISEEVTNRLGTIKYNSLRLLKLVNDLLALIRLEEGKDRLKNDPVDINSILSGLSDSVIHLADTKAIRIEKKLTPEKLVVDGDTQALEKIILNLLNNSIKFTDKGGKIDISSKLKEGNVVIGVQDTGIGISPTDLPYIFDRFHQVDGSTTRRYQGTGLGLALVKEMVEMQGGRVNVESNPGIGTLMEVEFPISKPPLRQPEANGFTSDDELTVMHEQADIIGGLTVDDSITSWNELAENDLSARATVLLTDDEPDMRRYLFEILAPDYRILQARDGVEGLKLAIEYKPDLLVLDLMLPGLDGLEVCRKLKREDKDFHGKIMLLTARVDEQSKLTALENGADDFLTKPFSSLEVRTRLRNLLETATLEKDLAERNERLEKTLDELRATQGQLIQSEKLNALGNLSAGLLHEVNNPLNYSLTALQLLQCDATVQANELLSEVVADIDEGMQRIRRIVTDLRTFAHPSTAEKQQAFDFSEAVESALRFTGHDLKGVTVHNEIPRPCEVMGSKSHLVQVLVNLIANAVKANQQMAEDHEAEIMIDAGESDDRLVIAVRDNGAGMDEQTLSRVFDPFFTTRDVGEGMGLGLSICHTIIENHGGKLRAESSPGKGSVFTFDLALSRKESR